MNLTQDQLANKYDIDQGTVSICVRRYDVPCVGKMYREGHSHPFKLYDEEKAIEAFKTHYREKAEIERRKARDLDDKAESFRILFEKAILFGENV